MNRDKWTIYHNFSKMYDNFIEEICESGDAEKLDILVWMNRYGEECQPNEAFECKVIRHIKYPDMCIIGGEVGENSSQKGGDYIDEALYLCERNFTHQSKTSNKEKGFTLMGLTTLSGKPLMCCVISKGVKWCSETESQIDFTINSCGSSDNQQEFIENNLEHGKTFFEPVTSKRFFLEVQLVCLKTK